MKLETIQNIRTIKKSVSLRGNIDMTLELMKVGNRANYKVSWVVDGREMQGAIYHLKKIAMKEFNTIHNNYDKVKWFDEIK